MGEVPTQTRVVVIGAGFSGVCAAIKLRAAGITDFVVLERAQDLGGVWHHNDYPGAACDVPISLYSFSFVHDFDWSGTHGGRAEIVDYINFCVDRYGVRENLQFGIEVATARWQDDGLWLVETDRGNIIATYVISACGLFNKPSLPDIDGLSDFSGRSFHSAQWQHDFDASGKVVAVIGTGCSSAQFLPEIVDEAEKIVVFQRSACHVMPKQERVFSDDERGLYRRFPILRVLERTAFERGTTGFGSFQFDAEVRARRTADILVSMSSQLREGIKRDKLLPTFPLGGKRPISSSIFLQTLDRDDVEVVTERIDRINVTGLATADGKQHDVDAIIFGTGFSASDYLVPLNVIGRDGRDLQETWRDGAFAYFGVLVDGFPNFLMIYGPNSNVVGSILQVIEPQVDFAVRMILEADRAGSVVEVAGNTVHAFNLELQAVLTKSVYGQNVADSYFTTAGRKIVTQWSGSPDELIAGLAAIDPQSCLVARPDVAVISPEISDNVR